MQAHHNLQCSVTGTPARCRFYIGAWVIGSGPHVCAASTFLAKLSPQHGVFLECGYRQVFDTMGKYSLIAVIGGAEGQQKPGPMVGSQSS